MSRLCGSTTGNSIIPHEGSITDGVDPKKASGWGYLGQGLGVRK